MQQTLDQLEEKRRNLYRELCRTPNFRRGTISANYRRCGKDNCACHKKDHPGHGPQYLWNATIEGESRAKNLRLGPELQKVTQEVESYRSFTRLCQELVQVNEKICDQCPAPEINDEKELDRLKKKLQRIFARRFGEKQNV